MDPLTPSLASWLETLAANAQLEHRRRRNWFLFVATSILSTTGVAVAVSPLLTAQPKLVWPWAPTNFALIASLSICLIMLALHLTQQEWRLCGLRGQLLESQREILEEHVGKKVAYQFVDNVSHEFRTPLTVIKEYASALHEGLAGETTAEQRRYLETIVHRTLDLGFLVDDLLDISRIETGFVRTNRRACSVVEIMQRAQSTLERKASAAQVVLELAPSSDLYGVYCDPEKISRVIMNLAVNAIKFSDRGSSVRLWATRGEGDVEVVVGVTDHGPGIARENLAMIFERFRQLGHVRSSTKGFGLGLNIVKELVSLNFGRLQVESTLGTGSTFSFTLPRAEPVHFLPLYLQRVGCLRADARFVSLLRVTVDEPEDGTSLADVHGFLEENIRSSDVVFPSEPATCLLVTVSREPEAEQHIGRFQKAWVQSNVARPGRPLPSVYWHQEGCWRIEAEGHAFIERFLSAYAPAVAELQET